MLILDRRFSCHVLTTLLAIILTTQAVALGSSQQIILSDVEKSQQHTGGKNDHTRDELFNFDIDFRRSANSLFITEVIDIGTNLDVNGSINIVPGEQSQGPDVIALVRVRSTNVDAVDRITTTADSQKLVVSSRSEDNDSTSKASVQITIVLFVRPRVAQLASRRTVIDTTNLDISIFPGLVFESYHMSLTSRYGTISGSETFSFTAHELDVHVIEGSIIGNWSLPSRIDLDVHKGEIDINLIPKMWSIGPTQAGILNVTMFKGDININMPFEQNKLSLRNGTTTIKHDYGALTANLVHSGQTKIISEGYSLINVTLQPYWSFYEWQGINYNNLTTDQFTGTTLLRILPPVIWSYFPVNPLCLMRSHHKTRNGRIDLSYPSQWCGIATGNVTSGSGDDGGGGSGYVKVTGRDYEVVEEDPLNVVVQRRPLGSRLDFEVGSGLASLDLG